MEPIVLRAMEGTQNHRSELDVVFASGERRKLILCDGELEGIHAILSHPEPPTEELKAAWIEYESFAFEHSDVNR